MSRDRVCACGCGQSLTHLRADAKWATRACAEAWRRAHPGKPLSDAGRPRRAHARSGRQVSYRKAIEVMAEARAWLGGVPLTDEHYRWAEAHLSRALPAKQRKATA